MKGYKGFDKDLKCRGHQFEVGKTYEEPKAKLCESGFHFCEYPLDTFNYYPPAGSRFCEVESDCVSEGAYGDDSKRVTTKISIGAEIDIAEVVKAAVSYTMERTTLDEGSSATGALGAASATGERGAASATGWRGAASATGRRGAASATGELGAASATGALGAASATGEQGAASATGWKGAASATGALGAASATGWQGAASATGEQGAASATGEHSVALAAGCESKAKGELGCAICCVERDEDDGHILAIKAAIVDGEKIKSGTWYTLRNGKLVEVE